MTKDKLRLQRGVSPLRSAIAMALLGVSAPVFASGDRGDARVVVPAGVFAADDAGATLLYDYGSFRLYRLAPQALNELRGASRGAVEVQSDIVQFEAAPFDPASFTGEGVPQAFRANKPTGRAARVVQFAGPIADPWLEEVRALGVQIVQFVPNNAYIVLADEAQLGALRARAANGDLLIHADTLIPWFKLNAALAARAQSGVTGDEIEVTIAIVKHSGNGAARSRIVGLARGAPIQPFSDSAGMESVTVRIADTDLATIASLGDVVSIERYVPPRRMDEVQNQIIAGNLTPTRDGPIAPGYLAFLAGRGFSTVPADFPIVSVVDDGIGDGSIVNGAGDPTLTLNLDGATSRVVFAQNCTTDANAAGVAGHGHINASIVGGFDNRVGFPFQFPLVYQRGQGVNPANRIANIKFFNNAGTAQLTNCGGSQPGMIRVQQDAGVAISSNSWGAAVSGDYNQSARDYDIGTRDADTTEAGVQPLVFVFAAGNQGPGARTVGSPGTAKNVITVGASENQRQVDEDGNFLDLCNVGPSGADNAMDIIGFSSRGPAQEGASVATARVKPEVIAPGTHIQGTASTAPGYDGTGVCDQFRPDNIAPNAQTTFASSSGTSHSTPAIAGVSSLVYRYLQTTYGIAAPSAAMIKAYLVAHPNYLTGVSANDNLPSNGQGFGMPNLSDAFASGVDRQIFDQTQSFSATGQSFAISVVPDDPSRPMRIAVSWSDAPGLISGNPAVNNLNLTVARGAETFRGNRFTGQFSNTTGTADNNNNTEAVFLPAFDAPVAITVTAANIAGDGVPGNLDTTDQDFALVCTNCQANPTFTLDAELEQVNVCTPNNATYNVTVGSFNGFATAVPLSLAGLPAGATSIFTPGSVTPPNTSVLTVSPGTAVAGTYTLGVSGTVGPETRTDNVLFGLSTIVPPAANQTAPANGAVGVSFAPTLTWDPASEAIDYTVELDDDPSFATINYTATITGTSHVVATPLTASTTYYWRIRSRNNCGATVSAVRSFDTGVLACQVFNSTDVPVALGPNANTVSNSTLAVAGVTPPIIGDIDVVTLAGTHTFIGDMRFELLSPGGVTTVRLIEQRCGSADNFDLNLNDGAASPLPGPGACVLTGGLTFRPEQPLAALNGGDPNGTWTLRATDLFNVDGGSLNTWGLQVCNVVNAAVGANDDVFGVTEDGSLSPTGGVLTNDTPAAGLTTTVVTPPANGTLDLNTNGTFVYQPAPNFCGADSFRYQATDGTNSDTGRVDITVSCVNDAPVAVANAHVANEDTLLSIAAPGVLGNDTDAEGNSLTAGGTTQPAGGSVTLAADGSFAYTPNANACTPVGGLPDTFTYRANDGNSDSAPGTVSVTVTCINDAPIGVADAYSATEDTPLVIAASGVLGNDTDVDAGDTLSTVFGTAATNGTVALQTSGAFTYTPNGNYCDASTPDTFTYRVNDGSTNSGTVTVSVTVACVDDGPVVVADTATVTEDAAVAPIDVLTNDTDVDAGPRTVQSVTQPANGTSAVGGGGANATFQPTANFCGSTTFNYTVNGGSSGAVNVTVTCVNDAPTGVGTIPAQSRTEGQPHTLATASYFTDVDAGDTLTYSATGLPAGLTINPATGAISGTIAIGQAASSPFNMVVTARDVATATVTQSFTFTVTSASDAIFAHGYED